MKATYKQTFLILFCLLNALFVWSQTPEDAQNWLQKLKQPMGDSIPNTHALWNEWAAHQNADYTQKAMDLLEKTAKNQTSKALKGQVLLMKTRLVLFGKRPYQDNNTEGWAKSAVQQAIELGDESLLFDGCYVLGYAYLQQANYEAGLFYFLKAIELAEKNKLRRGTIQNMKIFVCSYLYSTHNYSTVIAFCKDVLEYPINDLNDDNYIGLNNDLALAYRATAQYDSAIYYFQKVINHGKENNIGVWVGIASGNIGDVYNMMGKPEWAVPLWKMDIDTSLKYNEIENLGLTMLVYAEYLFKKGDKTLANSYLDKASAIDFRKKPNRLLFYKIKAAALKESGNAAAAYEYLSKCQLLGDTVNLANAKSSYEQVKLKLDFESRTNQFNLIQEQRKAEITRRNFLILGLLITLLVAWLLFVRLKLKHKLAENQAVIAESEVASAKEQLALFTQTLINKNAQIEQLNNQLHVIQRVKEDELINQSILTDEDWNRFRQLFEKANPGFFDRIKHRATDITAAELRLAALIKLNLDNKQMASMQGISPVSIRSNKSRLRQRLQLSSETDVEVFIKQL
jgi:DNA-binding CsgD family transcriptional regulator